MPLTILTHSSAHKASFMPKPKYRQVSIEDTTDSKTYASIKINGVKAQFPAQLDAFKFQVTLAGQ